MYLTVLITFIFSFSFIYSSSNAALIVKNGANIEERKINFWLDYTYKELESKNLFLLREKSQTQSDYIYILENFRGFQNSYEVISKNMNINFLIFIELREVPNKYKQNTLEYDIKLYDLFQDKVILKEKSKIYYLEFEETVDVIPAIVDAIEGVMSPLSISVTPKDSRIIIFNDREKTSTDKIFVDSVENLKLGFGNYTILAQNPNHIPSYYTLKHNIVHPIEIDFKLDPYNLDLAQKKNFYYPGLGHYFLGLNREGLLFSSLQTLFILSSLYFTAQYVDAADNYNEVKSLYDQSLTPSKYSGQMKDYMSTKNISLAMMGISTGLAIGNILVSRYHINYVISIDIVGIVN